MIYEHNFTGPSLKTHLLSRHHVLGSAAPQKLSKLTAELARLTFAPLIGGVSSFKCREGQTWTKTSYSTGRDPS